MKACLTKSEYLQFVVIVLEDAHAGVKGVELICEISTYLMGTLWACGLVHMGSRNVLEPIWSHNRFSFHKFQSCFNSI